MGGTQTCKNYDHNENRVHPTSKLISGYYIYTHNHREREIYVYIYCIYIYINIHVPLSKNKTDEQPSGDPKARKVCGHAPPWDFGRATSFTFENADLESAARELEIARMAGCDS